MLLMALNVIIREMIVMCFMLLFSNYCRLILKNIPMSGIFAFSSQTVAPICTY